MRFYHYTCRFHYPAIALTGLIRRTELAHQPGPAGRAQASGNSPREVVHLTTDPDPATQGWALHNRQLGADWDKTFIRFTLEIPDGHTARWRDVMTEAGAPGWWINDLAAASRFDGDEWYVAPFDIPRRYWRVVEDTPTDEILWRPPLLSEIEPELADDALDLRRAEQTARSIAEWYVKMGRVPLEDRPAWMAEHRREIDEVRDRATLTLLELGDTRAGEQFARTCGRLMVESDPLLTDAERAELLEQIEAVDGKAFDLLRSIHDARDA